MIWSSSFNRINILVRVINGNKSCLSYFIWDLFDYCWISPNYNNTFFYNCTLGQLTCPAILTKLLRAKWKIKLYIAIKYYINTKYILLDEGRLCWPHKLNHVVLLFKSAITSWAQRVKSLRKDVFWTFSWSWQISFVSNIQMFEI